MKLISSLLLFASLGFGQITIGGSGGGGCGSPVMTGLVGWYKADVGVTGSSPVTAVADNSGGGHTITGHGTLTLQTNQINGLPAILHDGSTGYFTGVVLPGGSATILVVSKLTSTASTSALTGQSISTGSLTYNFAAAGKMQAVDEAGAATIGAGTASQDTAFHQLSMTFTNVTGAWSFTIDRTADGSGTKATTITEGVDEIGQNFPFGQFFNGEWAEILLYSTPLSGPDLTTDQTYLNCRTTL